MRPVSRRIVTRCLRGAAFRPTRNAARSISACVTLGYSSRSSEVGEEEQLFIFVRLAHGNDTDFLCRFGMHYHHNLCTQQPECDTTLLLVVLTIIFKREVGPAKTRSASAKSRPCFVRFSCRLSSCQINRIHCIMHIIMHISTPNITLCQCLQQRLSLLEV